ncbi:sucrase ferredoxin [Mobilicoccus caccae]|uniref:Sucrase ferredoxin n=2 Tax=Mobilicoccus caccae TaxID=1859295 RepID=A0ABQ6IPW8_9MICO|nr:sucrase ferredoxin [Mobilicoccus caccae]
MWADADEPAWGSAAPATFWVALEQRGPWGNKAFVESRLDPRTGSAIERACAAAGGRALLIRSADDHVLARADESGTRRLFVSGGMSSRAPWLLAADIEDPALVLDLPFSTLVGPDPSAAIAALPMLRRTGQSVLLVCTNAKRDACCAVLGRPVALEAADMRPGRVWECTHTGGHRFSATGVVLPTGATLARLTTDLAVASLDAAARGRIAEGTNDARHHRGLSHLRPPVQAADAWVRATTGEVDVTALTSYLAQGGDGTTADAWVTVVHRDGHRWDLRVRKRFDPTRLRRNSCITDPVPAERWDVTLQRETGPRTYRPLTPEL